MGDILKDPQAESELRAALLAQGEPPVNEFGGSEIVTLREPESKRRIKRS